MEASSNLVHVSPIIDLLDKSIGLNPHEIGWSRVRSNASNCICCCSDNSITLVTNHDSYHFDHVPLTDIQFAQANTSLQHLAISNHQKIAIVNLLDHETMTNIRRSHGAKFNNETKFVNLAAHGLTMSDVIFWRWLDDECLAILTYDALYTCSLNQQRIKHPAFTALSNPSQHLMMDKVCECNTHLSELCQITNVQRDSSGNLFAISGLYSPSYGSEPPVTNININNNTHHQQNQHFHSKYQLNNTATRIGQTLKHASASVPSQLSKLADAPKILSPSKSARHQRAKSKSSSPSPGEYLVCGLVQVYCRSRDRSQIIQTHAVTFTCLDREPRKLSEGCEAGNADSSTTTIMVAAHQVGYQMRIYFTEMETCGNYLPTGEHDSCQTSRYACRDDVDFPTSINCSKISAANSGKKSLNLAYVLTKFGQLLVCSVTHSTILFCTSVTTSTVSSSVLESQSQGLVVICRNGKVLHVRLDVPEVLKLVGKRKSLKRVLISGHSLKDELDEGSDLNRLCSAQTMDQHLNSSLESETDILISRL